MLPIDKVGSWCSTGTISWPESLESQDGQMTIDGAKVYFCVCCVMVLGVYIWCCVLYDVYILAATLQ